MTTPPTTTPWVPMWPLEAATPPDVEGIPADVVVASGSHLIRNRFAAGDTQFAFRLDANGGLQWGAGGTVAPDLNLNRAGDGVLKFYGDIFQMENHLVIAGSGSPARLWFGSAFDTSIYSPYGGVMLATGRFDASDVLAANSGGDGSATVTIGYSLGLKMAGISFGLHDTNLYRFSAGTLKTDGALLTGLYSVVNYGHATDQLIIGDVSDWMGAPANRPGIIFGTANDAALAYDAPGILRCTGHLRITGQVNVFGGYLDLNTDLANIRMGAGLDTVLSRHQYAVLRTNSHLVVEGTNDPGAFVQQSRDALTVFTASRSRIGIGDSVTGAANPAIHFFRTASGTDENGVAFRIMTQGDGLRMQVTTSYALYGNETYANVLRVGADSKLWIGDPADDTNLYRSTAGVLKTDGSILAVGQLKSLSHVIAYDGTVDQRTYIGYTPIGQAGLTMCDDTYLHRMSPGVLGINGVAISTGASRPAMMELYRSTQTAVAYALVAFEVQSIGDPGFTSLGNGVRVEQAGWYRITTRVNFTGGTGDGMQVVSIRHADSGGASIQEQVVSRRESVGNAWNSSQSGTVVFQVQASQTLYMLCHGAATGTPGNYDTAVMTVERLR